MQDFLNQFDHECLFTFDAFHNRYGFNDWHLFDFQRYFAYKVLELNTIMTHLKVDRTPRNVEEFKEMYLLCYKADHSLKKLF